MATVLAEESKKDVKKDITSLRSALEWLDSQGDVLTTDVEVDPDLEITGRPETSRWRPGCAFQSGQRQAARARDHQSAG